MKTLLILVAFSASALAETSDILPLAFPKSRYAETVKKSPFILETKVTDPGPPPVNPFANLFLTMVSKTPDGQDYVLVKRVGEERAMKFIGDTPDADGISVKQVREGSGFRGPKVVLQKGSETGEIGFKEDSIGAPPAAPGGAANNRGPAVPGQNFPKPGAAPGMPVPQMPAVRPPTNGVSVQNVPRPTNAVPMPVPMPKAPQQMSTPQQPTGAQKVRVRGINN